MANCLFLIFINYKQRMTILRWPKYGFSMSMNYGYLVPPSGSGFLKSV